MIRNGREVSRIEGFSDAVFGFALTLLVVSLEVPDNFEALKEILRGFIPFAATFALVCWIWFEHYAFFRKFDAEDGADDLPELRVAVPGVVLRLSAEVRFHERDPGATRPADRPAT